MIQVGDAVVFRPESLSWHKRDRSVVYPVIGVKSPNGSDTMVYVVSPSGETFWEWGAAFKKV